MMGPYLVLPFRVRVNLETMAMKGYSTFPKALALLEPHHQIVKCHIQNTHWGQPATRKHFWPCLDSVVPLSLTFAVPHNCDLWCFVLCQVKHINREREREGQRERESRRASYFETPDLYFYIYFLQLITIKINLRFFRCVTLYHPKQRLSYHRQQCHKTFLSQSAYIYWILLYHPNVTFQFGISGENGQRLHCHYSKAHFDLE